MALNERLANRWRPTPALGMAPLAMWVAAAVFLLCWFFTATGVTALLALLIAAVLAAGGAVVHAIDQLRVELRTARIAAEALGSVGAGGLAPIAGEPPAPEPPAEMPRARPYTRPPWEKDPGVGS